MRVAAVDFRRRWEEIGPAAAAALEAVGQSGRYILGQEVEEFEAELARGWGRRYCVGVASGTDALEIGLRALGCGPGTRVLTTPLSAFATTLAIVRRGAVPVFVDVDERGGIDLDQCERVLRSRPDVRTLVPVHLYGHPLDPAGLRDLQARFDCRIVEDCAQSALARRGGRPCGGVGQVAATSFYPTKNLGALGDGGAVLTDDEAVADKARSLRDYGQTAKYRHDALGYNSRLDELQAAFLRRVVLPRLAAWNARRRGIAGAYRAGIRHPGVAVPPPPGDAEPAWHLFPILVAAGRKDAFVHHLRRHGVDCGQHYPVPIPAQAAMGEVAWEAPFEFPRARAFCAGEVSLPLHPHLTPAEVSWVVETVNAWEG